MTALTSTLKKMLNGLAHADAGEYLSRRQKQRHMKSATVHFVKAEDPAPQIEIPEVTAARPRRRVAMYMGSELPGAVMEYVMQTCSSLDHDLLVLTFESESISGALLKPYREKLENLGIAMKVKRLTGEPVKGLSRYLRSHPEVAFMACKESGYLGRSYVNGTQAKNALPVPVVVVATQSEAAAAAPADREQDQNLTGTA